jgi:hypothetical protein
MTLFPVHPALFTIRVMNDERPRRIVGAVEWPRSPQAGYAGQRQTRQPGTFSGQGLPQSAHSYRTT